MRTVYWWAGTMFTAKGLPIVRCSWAEASAAAALNDDVQLIHARPAS